MSFYALMLFRVYQLNHDIIRNISASEKHSFSTFIVASIIVFEVVLQAVFWGVRAIRHRRLHRLKVNARAEAETIANQKAWETNEMPLVVPGSLILQPGERCVLNETATIYAPVVKTRRQGGFGGVSIPIGHTGIRARVGQFTSSPVITTKLMMVNEGQLYLTNLRIVILGSVQMSQLPIRDFLTLDVHIDGVTVGMSNGKPVTIKTGSAKLGIYLRRLLNDEV